MNKDKIRELSDREQARNKLPIFFGSRSNYYHPIREVIGNSIDEIENNFDSGTIVVELGKDCQTITIDDSGRGMPMKDKNDCRLLFETLFAGTKYEPGNKIQVGTNGVGNTTINYTSLDFSCYSRGIGSIFEAKYKEGVLQSFEKKDLKFGTADESGTSISFKLDPTMYTNTTFEYERVKEIVNHFSANSPNINFRTIHLDQYHEYNYKDLIEFFKENTDSSQSTSGDLKLMDIAYKDEYTLSDRFDTKDLSKEELSELEVFEEENTISLVMSTSNEPVAKTFLNRCWLEEGGIIEESVYKGVRYWLNKYCKENRLFPKNVNNFVDSDIRSSLSFVCSIFSTLVEYEGQTKLKTSKTLYGKRVIQHVQTLLDFELIENKVEFDKFVDHILTVQKYNSNVENEKKKLKKILSAKSKKLGDRPKKLKPCLHKGPNAELFITEGDSALGAVVSGRDSSFQAAMPIRGKILNCIKATIPTILENDTVRQIINEINWGWVIDEADYKDLQTFDLKKSKYGSIIITCFDKDTEVKMMDGSFKTFETLVEENKNGIEEHWVYSCKKDGEIVPGKAINPRIIERVNRMAKVFLDDGSYIGCTPDHKLMMRDGTYKEVQFIQPNESVMPLYSKINEGHPYNFGRELLFDNKKGGYEYSHHIAAKILNGYAKWKDGGYHIHHIDENPSNNNPSNLEILTVHDHLSHHASSKKNIERFLKVRQTWGKSYNGTEQHLHDIKGARAKGAYKNCTWAQHYNGSEKHLSDIQRAKERGSYKNSYVSLYNKSEANRESTAKLNKRDDVKVLQKRGNILSIGKKILDLGYELTEELIISKEYKNNPNWKKVKYKNNKTKEIHFIPEKGTSLKKIMENFDSFDEFVEGSKNRNHKVVKIEYYDTPGTDVYCLTVEDHHNFAIRPKNSIDDSCVFVKNCDQDFDGLQIRQLLVAMFWRVARPAVEAGMIKIAQTPLFEIKVGDNIIYCFSDQEKDDKIKELGDTKFSISRAKGLGELDAEVLEETAMNPKTRRLLVVTVEDAEKYSQMVKDWMDDGSEERKRMINSQIHKYICED